MKSTIELDDYEELHATMTITMSVKEWNALKEQLDTEISPSWRFGAMLKSQKDLLLLQRKSLVYF